MKIKENIREERISDVVIKRLIEQDKKHKCPKRMADTCVRIVAIANLPSRFGNFQVIAFYNNKDENEHVAFVHGNVLNKEEVPVRIHSECLTGDAVGSLRCDCRDQLEASLKFIGRRKLGIVIYLRQEGRGIGLANKIRAYQLQDQGLDTLEANLVLGFKPDEREYSVAAHMLNSLDVKSIKLISNNHKKFDDLRKHGIKITERIPLEMKPNRYNLKYLKTKKERFDHMLENLA